MSIKEAAPSGGEGPGGDFPNPPTQPQLAAAPPRAKRSPVFTVDDVMTLDNMNNDAMTHNGACNDVSIDIGYKGGAKGGSGPPSPGSSGLPSPSRSGVQSPMSDTSLELPPEPESGSVEQGVNGFPPSESGSSAPGGGSSPSGSGSPAPGGGSSPPRSGSPSVERSSPTGNSSPTDSSFPAAVHLHESSESTRKPKISFGGVEDTSPACCPPATPIIPPRRKRAGFSKALSPLDLAKLDGVSPTLTPCDSPPASPGSSCPGSLRDGRRPGTPKKGAVVSFFLDGNEDAATSREEKKLHSHSRGTLLSTLYAIVIVLMGLAFFLADALNHTGASRHLVGIFMSVIFTASVAFMIYLQYLMHNERMAEKRQRRARRQSRAHFMYSNEAYVPDSRKPKDQHVVVRMRRSAKQNGDVAGAFSEMPGGSGASRGSIGSSVPQTDDDESMEEDIDDDLQEYIMVKTQTASLAHEGTSLFIRVGLLLFSVANLMYIGLDVESIFRMWSMPECEEQRPVRYPPFFHLVFLMVQTYFVFKNRMITVKRFRRLVRFCLMHILTTNLCVWIKMLVHEVYVGVMENQHHNDVDCHQATKANPHGDEEIIPHGNDTHQNVTDCPKVCKDDSLLHLASPYLFPFVLEYSLIAVAMLAAMFMSLNITLNKDTLNSVRRSLRAQQEESWMGGSFGEQLRQYRRQHHKHEDPLARSHVGLFFGVVLGAVLLTTITVFYFMEAKDDDNTVSSLIYHYVDISTCLCILITVCVGMYHIFNLGISTEQINSIDHILMLLSMAGVVLFELFVCISALDFVSNAGEDVNPDLHTGMILDATSAFITMIQTILQTLFIMEGLQRFASSTIEQDKKPGRDAITFLIIANVGMWMFKSFIVKKVVMGQHVNFYGETTWPIIVNVNIPLVVFYRFHSCVCLADMWSNIYKANNEASEFRRLSHGNAFPE